MTRGRFQSEAPGVFEVVVPEGHYGCRLPVGPALAGVRVPLRQRGERRLRGEMQANKVDMLYTSMDDFVATHRTQFEDYEKRNAASDWSVEEAAIQGLAGKRVRFRYHPLSRGPRYQREVIAVAASGDGKPFYQFSFLDPLASLDEDGRAFAEFVASFRRP